MSVPYNIIYCNKCAKEWPSFVLNGYFLYKLPDGRVANIGRQLGWCGKCKSIAAVECLPCDVDLNINLNYEEKKYSKLKSILSNMVFYRIYWFFNKEKRLKFERAAAVSIREIDKIKSVIQVLFLRSESEKCLSCGSADVYLIDESPSFSNEELRSTRSISKYTKYIHPECGGGLSIKTSGGVQIAVDHPKKYYDVNGNFLRIVI